MERTNSKKWIKPAIVVVILIFIFFFAAIPFFNRWMYPLEYRKQIVNSVKVTGTDPYLVVAIIRAESNFDPKKVSPVGARGLMQLMPGTVEEIIQKGNFSSSYRNYIENPLVNIKMGCWYISFLVREFKGNKMAVMAAYNAGPGRVHKWIKQKVWDGTYENSNKIPYKETRQYVQRVTWYYQKYKEIYGGELNK